MDKLIETIVSAIEDKKGKNIVSLDLSGFDGAICSHFVVCNADSTTQVCAIAAEIEEKVFEKLGEKVVLAVLRAVPESLLHGLRARLGSVRAPKEIRVIDRIPLSPSGKPLRPKLPK